MSPAADRDGLGRDVRGRGRSGRTRRDRRAADDRQGHRRQLPRSPGQLDRARARAVPAGRGGRLRGRHRRGAPARGQARLVHRHGRGPVRRSCSPGCCSASCHRPCSSSAARSFSPESSWSGRANWERPQPRSRSVPRPRPRPGPGPGPDRQTWPRPQGRPRSGSRPRTRREQRCGRRATTGENLIPGGRRSVTHAARLARGAGPTCGAGKACGPAVIVVADTLRSQRREH